MRRLHDPNKRAGLLREAGSALLLGLVLCGLVAFGYTRWAGSSDNPTPPTDPSESAAVAVAPVEQPQQEAPFLTVKPGKKFTAEELRKRYPFESMKDRLNYEIDRTDASEKPAELPAETMKRLQTVETSFDSWKRWELRRRSLAMLHSDQVEQFISREGFGLSRMPDPAPSFLELASAPPIPFTSLKNLPSDQDASGVAGGNKQAPAMNLLEAFHDSGRFNFLSPNGFGFVKDRDHVAGFVSHQFRSMPQMPAPGGKVSAESERDHWQVRRLELVSLLKHDKPAVYVSDALPRMQDLKKAKTRPLNEFEEKALKSLNEGEDLLAESTANRIHMVGSLRATKQCLECHNAHRGDLLGAFSYDLQREAPVRAEK
jgi:hypothetical protein